MKIDRYEPIIENGKIVIYAIKGKSKYPIPTAFSEMCDDRHLDIEQVTYERPELFDLDSPTVYVPRLTA